MGIVLDIQQKLSLSISVLAPLQVASWKGLVHSVRSGRHGSAGQPERPSMGPSSRRAWKSAMPCWQS